MAPESAFDLEIAPGVKSSRWKRLHLDDPAAVLSADWLTAIEFFQARLTSRFLDPIDALIGLERSHPRKSYGFVVLAVDCLLIEAIQGFREGVLDHTGKSRGLFTRFMQSWGAFQECVPSDDSVMDRAKQFYSECRSALHHTASTGPAFRVRVAGPLLTFRKSVVELNRATFHDELKKEFQEYLTELRHPLRGHLRLNLKKKMDYISLKN